MSRVIVNRLDVITRNILSFMQVPKVGWLWSVPILFTSQVSINPLYRLGHKGVMPTWWPSWLMDGSKLLPNPIRNNIQLNVCRVVKQDRGSRSPSNFACTGPIYTQSQKKRTMDFLASPVTQGQGQVTPAGSYLITGIWNRSQKTSFSC